VGGFGTIAYIQAGGSDGSPIRGAVMSALRSAAGACLATRNADGYRITLRPDQYVWGSNMILLEQAMVLIVLDRFEPNPEYVQAALDDLHYLLGRNTLDQCYITGVGAKPVLHPHHRPSVADWIPLPVPGLVAGGPDRNLEDPTAQADLKGLPPARCYIDDATSYSTNEIAIYWNAPAVFVLSSLIIEKT
jgi:endoglucanase